MINVPRGTRNYWLLKIAIRDCPYSYGPTDLSDTFKSLLLTIG